MANKPGDLVSIREFAEQYRVDIELVRAWIRKGRIPYQAIDGRRMVRKSDILVPVSGTPIGRFEDYPLADDYMRMAPAPVPVEVPNERDKPADPIPSRAKEAGAGSGKDRARRTA